MKKIQLENLQESVYVFLAVVIGVLLFGILLYFIVCNNAKQYEYISCGVFFISFLVLFIYIICQLMRISKIGLRASCIKIHEEYIEIVYKKGIEIVDKIKIYNENIDEVLIEFNLPFFSYEEYLKMKFSKMDEILQTDINLQKIQEELFATNFNYFSSNFKKYMSEVECKVGFPKASIAVDFLIKLSNETKKFSINYPDVYSRDTGFDIFYGIIFPLVKNTKYFPCVKYMVVSESEKVKSRMDYFLKHGVDIPKFRKQRNKELLIGFLVSFGLIAFLFCLILFY